MGKTALATNIAFNAALNIKKNHLKKSIAFFSGNVIRTIIY